MEVRDVLTGLEGANLDVWAAAHSSDVMGIAIDPSSVLVRGRPPSSSVTATRLPGHLIDAINEALQLAHRGWRFVTRPTNDGCSSSGQTDGAGPQGPARWWELSVQPLVPVPTSR